MLRDHHSQGLVQLYHGGLRSPSRLTGVQPLSASPIAAGDDTGEGAREATGEEIEEIIEAFVQAAHRAYRAGFTGVEIHGAHGYLLTQFIDPSTNQRRDQWGGSLENRSRILMEIVRRIRTLITEPFILGVRISPEAYQAGQQLKLEESLEIARMLEQEKVDYLHISLGDVFRKPLSALDGAKTVVEHFAELPHKMALMVAGGLSSPEQAKQALSLGADLLALGRIAIAYADWPRLAGEPGFQPLPPPYDPVYLGRQGLSIGFVNYMKRWKGFVLES